MEQLSITATRRAVMSGTLGLAAAGATFGPAPANSAEKSSGTEFSDRHGYVVTKDGVAIFTRTGVQRTPNRLSSITDGH